jgi:hypothetical protein
MKRVWAGMGLLAVAGFGTAMLATPSGASEGPPPPSTDVELGASWSPNPASPGADVTLTPDEGQNCPILKDTPWGDAHEGVVAVVEADPAFSDVAAGDEIPMNADGSWSLDATAPDAPGVYSVKLECRASTWAEEMGWCGKDQEQPDHENAAAESKFALASYNRPVAPTWTFDCKFEFYTAELTVESGEESTTTTMGESPTPPPATPIPETPPFTG